MKKKNIHVTPHKDGGWQVKKGGAGRATKKLIHRKKLLRLQLALLKTKRQIPKYMVEMAK